MFQLLSQKEEKALTEEGLRDYYSELREYALHRKLTNTTPGVLTVAPHLKGITNKIAKKVTKVLCRCNAEILCDGQENIPNEAVLFACTHQGILDNFAWIPLNPRHSVVLHAAFVKKILLLAQYNTGLVLVSKRDGDAENRKNAKMDMITILLKGHSIWYYPEGTWNLSPNKLHLPMSHGFLDIAKKSRAPVVPVVLEYSYDSSTDRECITKVHMRYGKPLYVKESDDLNVKLEEYQAAVSTMRWELLEEKGKFYRKDISNREYINYLKGNLYNLKLGSLDIDFERAHIRGAGSEFYVFHHINDIPFTEDGKLLETAEVERLRGL